MSPTCPARPNSACPVTSLPNIAGTPATPDWSAWSRSQQQFLTTSQQAPEVRHKNSHTTLDAVLVVALIMAVLIASIAVVLHGIKHPPKRSKKRRR